MIKPQDKKILIITGICAGTIFLFWVLIYFPANKRFSFLKTELNSIKNEISKIESRGGEKGYDIVAMVESLQKDLKEAELKLPSQEEETLKFLSGEANRLGIEIVSMSPRPKRPFLDTNNNPILLEDKQCFEMPISIQMKGLYKSIGEYFRVLRENCPALVKIEGINIQKDETIAPKLKVNLELIVCLLCRS